MDGFKKWQCVSPSMRGKHCYCGLCGLNVSSLVKVCPHPTVVTFVVGSEHATRWKCQLLDENKSSISLSCMWRISRLFRALIKVQSSDFIAALCHHWWETINILEQHFSHKNCHNYDIKDQGCNIKRLLQEVVSSVWCLLVPFLLFSLLLWRLFHWTCIKFYSLRANIPLSLQHHYIN